MEHFYESHTSTSLKVHEWLAITIVIAMLASLALITKVNGSRVASQLQSNPIKTHHDFDILVKGAVDFPGIYHLHSEMQMKDILVLAGVKEGADLRRYNMEAWVKKGRVVHVPNRQFITVFVEGAVNGPTTIKLPKGSKVNELLNVVALTDDADVETLQKKRLLKDNEVISIRSIR